MRIPFLLGWVLMLAAFVAAAAESVARVAPGESGMIMSAATLWRAVAPASYLIFELRAGALFPHLWNPVMTAVLSVPAWGLLGVPGIMLAWVCRPGQTKSRFTEQELRDHEESLFLYDELAREARKWAIENGDDPNIDDRFPTHDLFDIEDGKQEEELGLDFLEQMKRAEPKDK